MIHPVCHACACRYAAVLALILLLMQGCASTRWFGDGAPPRAQQEVGFVDRKQSQTRGDVAVSVAVLSAAESEAVFGVPMATLGIQPVWLEIRNDSDQEFLFLPIDVDKEYFTPFELAWKFPKLAVGEDFLDRGAFFRGHHAPIQVAAAGVTTGFVFTHLDRGAKAVQIELLGDHAIKHFHFVVEVPGLKADYLQVKWDELFPAEQYRDLSLPQLRQALSELPCCALGGDRETPGDPLNLVIIGEPNQALLPLIHSGWDLTETLHGAAIWNTIKSSLFGSFYRNSPVSPLYVFDRPQDIALQKVRSSVDERNHLRLWLTPLRLEGRPVYIGQISRDIGIKLSSRTLVTHKIDPEVDEARDYLAQDLVISGFVKAIGYVPGVGLVETDAPRFNYTLDPYWTDGLRVVLIFGEDPIPLSDIDLLGWD